MNPNPWGGTAKQRDLLIAGFVGGTIAPLMRLIKEYFEVGAITKSIPVETWIFALCFGSLGALLVRIFQETDAKKAFAFGITLPSFLIAISAKAPEHDDKPTTTPPPALSPASPALQNGAAFFSFFAPSAIAQQPGGGAVNAPDRTIEIVTVDGVFAFKADILGANGQVLTTITSDGTRGMLTATPIPAGASAIRFTGNDAASRTVNFPENRAGTVVGIALRAKKEKSVGIGTIFGRGEDVKTSYEPEIDIRDKAPLGKEGWIFLGTREGERWKFQTLAGPGIPVAGQTYRVVFPVNLRAQPGTDQGRIAILAAGQGATITEVKINGNSVWARAVVAPQP